MDRNSGFNISNDLQNSSPIIHCYGNSDLDKNVSLSLARVRISVYVLLRCDLYLRSEGVIPSMLLQFAVNLSDKLWAHFVVVFT